jgi:ABC-2 type transport system ATP-binding protein
MTDWGLVGVTVRYGSITAIHDLTIRSRAGSIVAIVGGDGAGKTTALRTLVGVVAPSSGWVERPSAGEIGYLSASRGIYGDLSVMENLSFSGTAYGLGRADLSARAEELIERTGLHDARDRLAGDLSGGMRQKLALAVAMIHSPALLVLDEPTTGVDPVSRSEIWRLIARAASTGAAILLATSYVDEAERAGEVLMLSEGRAIAAGTPEEIIAGAPGRVFAGPRRHGGLPSWRRGRTWHIWSSNGGEVPGAEPAPIDLEDAVIVAELASGGERAQNELVGV